MQQSVGIGEDLRTHVLIRDFQETRGWREEIDAAAPPIKLAINEIDIEHVGVEVKRVEPLEHFVLGWNHNRLEIEFGQGLLQKHCYRVILAIGHGFSLQWLTERLPLQYRSCVLLLTSGFTLDSQKCTTLQILAGVVELSLDLSIIGQNVCTEAPPPEVLHAQLARPSTHTLGGKHTGNAPRGHLLPRQ